METETAETPRRTRKSKPRTVYFVGAAIRGKELVQSRVEASTEEAAAEAFKAQHKLNVKSLEGPFYDAPGARNGDGVVYLEDHELMFSGKAFKGQYNGWNVHCNGIRALKKGNAEYKNNELVQVNYVSPISGDSSERKPKSGKRTAVKADQIEALTALS